MLAVSLLEAKVAPDGLFESNRSTHNIYMQEYLWRV